MVTKTNIT